MLDLMSYKEHKPNFLKRILWRLVNSTIFPVVGIGWRMKLVRFFGANTGNDSCYYRSVRIFAPWNLEIVNHVMMGERVEIYNKGKVCIGQNVIISRDVFICTASHDVSSPTMGLVVKPVTICDNVWIAAKATILPGVTIGEGAVVGACAVVTRDVEPWTVVGGNPARFIKKRQLKDISSKQ